MTTWWLCTRTCFPMSTIPCLLVVRRASSVYNNIIMVMRLTNMSLRDNNFTNIRNKFRLVSDLLLSLTITNNYKDVENDTFSQIDTKCIDPRPARIHSVSTMRIITHKLLLPLPTWNDKKVRSTLDSGMILVGQSVVLWIYSIKL